MDNDIIKIKAYLRGFYPKYKIRYLFAEGNDSKISYWYISKKTLPNNFKLSDVSEPVFGEILSLLYRKSKLGGVNFIYMSLKVDMRGYNIVNGDIIPITNP